MNGLQDARTALFAGGEPPVKYGQWSQLAPRLMERDAQERQELLGAANIAPADWTHADGYWSLTLASECARGDRARAEAFGLACAKELASRRKSVVVEAPALPRATESPAAPEDATLAAPPPTPCSFQPPALVAVPMVAVPTFLRAKPTPHHAARESVWSPCPDRETPGNSPPPVPHVRLHGATLDLPAFDPPAPRAPLPFSLRPSRTPSAPSPRPALQPQSGQTIDLSRLVLPPAPTFPARPQAAPPEPRRDLTATVALDPDLVARALSGKPPEKS